MKKIIKTIAFVFLSINVIAQEANESRISDVWISSGVSLGWPVNFGSFEQFNSLAPNSELLKKPITNPNTYGYSGNLPPETMFNASLGIKLFNKAKSAYSDNRILRLGFSFNNFNDLYQSGGQSTFTKTLDTLYNSQLMPAATIDSIRNTNTYASYKTSQVRFDASLIFNTDRSERWSLFAGFGANFGISVASVTEIIFDESARKVINEIALNQNQNANDFFFSQSKTITERYNNKTNLGGSLYIPLGLNLRCGLSKGLLSHLNIYAELRPTLSWFSIPETGYIAFTGANGLFGLRYAIF